SRNGRRGSTWTTRCGNASSRSARRGSRPAETSVSRRVACCAADFMRRLAMRFLPPADDAPFNYRGVSERTLNIICAIVANVIGKTTQPSRMMTGSVDVRVPHDEGELPAAPVLAFTFARPYVGPAAKG